MFKIYSRIHKLPIFSVNTEGKVAEFSDFLVDPDNGKIMAVFVKIKDFLKSDTKLVLSQDILEWSNALYIQDPANIVDYEEIVRLKKLVEDHFSLIDLKVVTKSGDRIGVIEDYILETNTSQIVRFYISEHKFFSNRRFIIGIDQVHEITKDALVVKDAFEKVSVTEGEEMLLKSTFPATPTMSKREE